MELFFGLSLDLRGHSTKLEDGQAIMGVKYCGPLGLLDILEIQLGLSGEFAPNPIRVEIFKQCLASADNGQRFYSKSLMVNSTAVASQLLEWRDQLVFAGWMGESSQGQVSRIDDLALVEEATKSQNLPLGFSDRFQRVLKSLPVSKIQIHSIELIEPKELYDQNWNSLFSKLKESGVQMHDRSQNINSELGDLGKIQKWILEGDNTNKVSLAGDGSVVILRSPYDSQAGNILAKWMIEHPTKNRVVIHPQGSNTLDLILQNNGQPSFGVRSLSSKRPIQFILPLTLELLWKPLNPDLLSEYLRLPVHPVPTTLRKKLLSCLASLPGIGNSKWQETVGQFIQIQKTDEKSAIAGPDEIKKIENRRQLINTWLQPPEFGIDTHAPKSVIIDKLNSIVLWSKQRSITDERNIADFSSLINHSMYLKSIIETDEKDTISRLDIHNWLELVQSTDRTNSSPATEAGSIPYVSDAGAIVDPESEVIWWDFASDNTPDVKKTPWRRNERQFLKNNGIHLKELSLESEYQSWLRKRAVLQAKDRLILVFPDHIQGKKYYPHQLYDQLQAISENLDPVELNYSEWINGTTKGLLTTINLDTMPVTKLPPKKKWWKLDHKHLLEPRELESYSSLSGFFYSPFQWVLRYKARLKYGILAKPNHENALPGTLAHALLEKLLIENKERLDTISDIEMDRLIDTCLPELLHHQGGVFLLPGQEVKLDDFSANFKKAAKVLVEHIRANNWHVKEMEQKTSGKIFDQEISGFIDLVLNNQMGEIAVVDLKWGGLKYRQDELEKNKHVQLNLYAKMLSPSNWVSQSYFILSTGTMLSQDQGSFNAAVTAAPEEGESSETLWHQIENTYAWRREQLDLGWIEVPDNAKCSQSRIFPENGLPPEGCLEMPKDPSGFHDFQSLLGWEE
jgi:hypothetical protein